MTNRFNLLRAACLARSTRPFLARGKSVQRCPHCQLAASACICAWRINLVSAVDVVLILHRDEVFKPTNTGRLIADVLPANTFAFEWSRTEPDPDLLRLLTDPMRYPVLVFPPAAADDRPVHLAKPQLSPIRRLTLVLLDGTWKQAGKMYRTSRWLADLPLLCLAEPKQGAYAVRQAIRDGQLATAEAAAEILQLCGEGRAAAVLEDYFAVFNEHYLATRGSRTPAHLPAHKRLAEAKRSATLGD